MAPNDHLNAHCDPAAAPLQGGIPADWLVPNWPAPAHVHALCTTRVGGVSVGAYASMNLGSHVGDAAQAVAANRQRLAEALGAITPGAKPVLMQQVHGSDCVQLTANTPDGEPWDAAVSTEPGVVCTIMVADCLPVLLTDTQGRAVGAAHAGWRGLAGGVLEALIQRFRPIALAGCALPAIKTGANHGADELLAWLGPCIGPGAFEVGPEVRAAFCDVDAGAAPLFIAHGNGKYLADLPGLARRRLAALGVTRVYGNDGSDAWCTVRQASRFFSHRRDGGVLSSGVTGTGRMAACIWLG